jgi:hypothetical protein
MPGLIPQPAGNTAWVQPGNGLPSQIFLQYMLALDTTLQSAWTPYTPTVSASVGTFTTVSASGRYVPIGKIVLIRMRVTITTNGTAASSVSASLPFGAADSFDQVLYGRENAVSGKMLAGRIISSTSNVLIVNYDASYPGANGALLDVQGIYETA